MAKNAEHLNDEPSLHQHWSQIANLHFVSLVSAQMSPKFVPNKTSANVSKVSTYMAKIPLTINFRPNRKAMNEQEVQS